MHEQLVFLKLYTIWCEVSLDYLSFEMGAGIGRTAAAGLVQWQFKHSCSINRTLQVPYHCRCRRLAAAANQHKHLSLEALHRQHSSNKCRCHPAACEAATKSDNKDVIVNVSMRRQCSPFCSRIAIHIKLRGAVQWCHLQHVHVVTTVYMSAFARTNTRSPTVHLDVGLP